MSDSGRELNATHSPGAKLTSIITIRVHIAQIVRSQKRSPGGLVSANHWNTGVCHTFHRQLFLVLNRIRGFRSFVDPVLTPALSCYSSVSVRSFFEKKKNPKKLSQHKFVSSLSHMTLRIVFYRAPGAFLFSENHFGKSKSNSISLPRSAMKKSERNLFLGALLGKSCLQSKAHRCNRFFLHGVMTRALVCP